MCTLQQQELKHVLSHLIRKTESEKYPSLHGDVTFLNPRKIPTDIMVGVVNRK